MGQAVGPGRPSGGGEGTGQGVRSVASQESKPVVLLVDDSVDVHRLLRARLRHEHISLLAAASGREALDVLQAQSPATILLDLDMPGMDGFELLRVLKDTPATHNIPVIILSSSITKEDIAEGYRLGANTYIQKQANLMHAIDVLGEYWGVFAKFPKVA